MNQGPHISNWSGTSFLAVLPWNQLEYAILESPAKTALLRISGPDQLNLEDFPSGVLFGEQCELRWKKRRNGRFHLVQIAEKEIEALPGSEAFALQSIGPADYGLPERIYLWGQPHGGPNDAQWYEARIPRLITEYPPEFSGRRVAVGLAHYTMDVTAPVPLPGDAETRAIVVSRCTGLEKR